MKIGVRGEFDSPKSIDEISLLIGKHTHTEPQKFSFGKKHKKQKLNYKPVGKSIKMVFRANSFSIFSFISETPIISVP